MSCCNVVVTTTSNELCDVDESDDFHFERKLTDFIKTEKLSFSNICLILVSMLMIYISGIFFGFRGADIFIAIIVGSVLFMAFGGNKKIFLRKPKNVDEKWSITLTQTHLSWLSPPTMVNKSNEISFEIDLEDIQQIQQSYSSNDEAAPFTFFMKDGVKLNPGLYSSVNMKLLIKKIQRHGVPFELKPKFDYS